MRSKNWTVFDSKKNESYWVLILSTVMFFLLIMMNCFFQVPTAISEPIIIDNSNGTKTVTWTLDNASDYNLYNLTLENGAANLTFKSYWWNQSSQSEFETGTMFNINPYAMPGDIILNSTALGEGENLIANGNFESASDWSFISSDNVTTYWDTLGEYGGFNHHSAFNPIYNGEQRVTSGISNGDKGSSVATDIVDALQISDDNKYWRVQQDEFISITGFDVLGRTGEISKVVLWARHRVDPSRYEGDNTLEYKNESGIFIPTVIKPLTSTNWSEISADISEGYSPWTWGDVANLELNFTNNDVNPQNNFVEWDKIWLEVTIEPFDQTAYINQTFQVQNTTGFRETSYEDFSKSKDLFNVNLTLVPNSVLLDYASAFSFGQKTLYANDTSCGGTYIGQDVWQNLNFGGDLSYWAGGTIQTFRTLIYFDTSSIPSNAIITDATLQLYVETVSNNIPLNIHRVNMDWDEGSGDSGGDSSNGVTWLNADINPPIFWSPGGEFDSPIYNSTFILTSNANSWQSFNITSLVQEWIDGIANCGLIIKDVNEGQDRTISFTSDEGISSQRPKLIVSWALPNYHTYGNLTSQVFDAEKNIDDWGKIFWNCETPAGTMVGIQTRSGDVPDPDASWEPWTLNYSNPGDRISSKPGRYIQYRAHLETSSPSLSPILNDVTIIIKNTNLTFDRTVETFLNATRADMSIAINDTVVWSYGINFTSSWIPELVDISEYILSRGYYEISLRIHLIIETDKEVNLSAGYDNVAIGGLGNESMGEYVSIGHDAGSKANWKEIRWSVSLPLGTKIIIQTRTSPDNSSWEGWSTAYSNPSGDIITSTNNRYIQYRAILKTTNSSNSPVLSDVHIFFNLYLGNGTLEMINDYNESIVVSWGKFRQLSDPKGQQIKFSYSIDSGSSWITVPSNGDMSFVDTSTGKIRFKADFLTSDPSVSPTLFEFSLTYFTNNMPQLLFGGYINKTGGFGFGWFNFSVMYKDLDNDYPIPIKLTISGDGNYNLTMDELDATDFNLTDGKWYFCNASIPKGFYQYRFIAYDGLTWNSTTFVGFVVNNNAPTLRYGDVEPKSAKGGSLFNFTVSYFDKDNDAPASINITISGPSSFNLSMMEQDALDTIYSDGKDYYCNMVLNKGTYSYLFTTFDGENWGYFSSSILVVENNPPELYLPLVIPPTGYIGTTYNFTVIYSDLDGDAPDSLILNLTGPSPSGSYVMLEVDLGDTNYQDGKLYYFQISGLTKGYYTYSFAANDSEGDWGQQTEIQLLGVLNSHPVITTINDNYAVEDILYSVKYECFDPDFDSCVWFLETNATWLTIDSISGYLNGTPDNCNVGWYWVNVSVSDRDEGQNWTYFILNVNNTLPQIITTSPPQSIDENQWYGYDFNGEDEAEGNSYWTLDTNAPWLNIDFSFGILSGIPGTFDIGIYFVNVTLQDGNGGFDFFNFTLTVNDISPPYVYPGSDDTTYEDSFYTFDASGSIDNSGQISNYTWYFGDGKIGYGVSPAHIYTNSGLYLVVLMVKDPSGNEGLGTMSLNVLNPSPFADAGPDKNASEGEEVYLDASGSYDTQSDTSSLIYMWDFDDDLDFDDGFGAIISHIWYDEGVFSVSLKVIDDNGDYDIDNITVIVGNVPPTIELGGPYFGFEDREIFFFSIASDFGNDVLWYRWDWDNDGVYDSGWSMKTYANHTWTQFGTYTVRVEVTDGDNGYSNDTALVVITRPEQPPVISGVGGRYVHFDYPYLLDLTPYVFDPDTPKADLMIATSDPTHIEVDGLILTLLYPESMVYHTKIVIITVSDGKNKDNDTLTVSITANYPPDVSGKIPDVSFNEGQVLKNAVDLDNYFTDKDKDHLSYHFLGNVHVRTEINSSTGNVTFSADPNWFGIENLTVRAYDPLGAFTEQNVKVTVNEVNFPPTIQGIEDVYVRLNSPWELQILNPVYVWDDDSILDLTLSTNSSFVTLSPTKEGVLVFYYFDPSITTEIIRISVSDGEYTASTNVIVHVSLQNWPPYIKNYNYPANVRFDEDTELSDHFNLNDFFADNETDLLTYTQIVANSDLFVNINSQGSVSFSAKENWFGLSTVTFRAQDTSGAWASFVINVTVDPINDAPIITQKITYLRISEDEEWIIDLDDYFEDIENKDNLTFSCNKKEILIDPITHEARWKRNGKTSLKGLIFTASDGEASVSMEEIDLKVITPFSWLWVILAAVLGAVGVIAYREIRYRYRVEEVFVINNAGIILVHLTHGKSKLSMDVELVGAMLTAVQNFVVDSFLTEDQDGKPIDDKIKSLEELEFGGYHLVLEQGEQSFLCAVIDGYTNKRLRKKMRVVLSEFEDKYKEIFKDWDGLVETFEEGKKIIMKLFKISDRDAGLKSSMGILREVASEDNEVMPEEISTEPQVENVDLGSTEENPHLDELKSELK